MKFTIPEPTARLEVMRLVLGAVLAAVALGIVWASPQRPPAAVSAGRSAGPQNRGTAVAQADGGAFVRGVVGEKDHAIGHDRTVIPASQGANHLAAKGSGGPAAAP